MILVSDSLTALRQMPGKSVHCCVTSPPYFGLRSYDETARRIDPFFGAGTTGLVAQKHGRDCVGIELNPDYIAIANERLGLAPVSALPHDDSQLTDVFS